MTQTADLPQRQALHLRILRLAVVVSLLLTTISFVPLYPLLTEWTGSLRPQLCFGILLLAAVALVLRRFRLLTLLLMQLPIHSLCMAVLFHNPIRTEPSAQHDLSICSVNVHVSNRSAETLIPVLPQQLPDVIGVLELNPAMWSSLERQFGSSHPHRLHCFCASAHFGIGVVSRYPIIDHEPFPENPDEIPVVNAVLQTPRGKVRILLAHLLPPLSSRFLRIRNESLQTLVTRLTTARQTQPEIPAILVGDLNCTPWVSAYSQFLSQLALRDSLHRGNLNATCNLLRLPGCGLVIDHAFFSHELDCVSRRTLADFGSDHRPLLTEYRFLRPQSVSAE